MKIVINWNTIGGSIGTFLVICIIFYYRALIFAYLQKWAEHKGKQLFKKHFKTSAIDIAKQMNELATQAYEIAFQNCKDAFAMEMSVLSEINVAKAKLGDPTKSKKHYKYDERLQILQDDYTKRLLVSQLTRILMAKVDEARTLVNTLAKKLLCLEQDAIREDDVKALEDVATKPRLLNEEVQKILSSVEASKTAREKMFVAKGMLSVRESALVSATEKKEKEENLSKIAVMISEAKVDFDRCKEESEKADVTVQEVFKSVKETVDLSLKLEGLDTLFNKVEVPVSNVVVNGDVEMAIVIEKPVEFDWNNFDWEYYISVHEDLQKAGINDEDKAKRHYTNFGKNEQRKTKNPFDWEFYVNEHPDLQRAGITTSDKALKHYNSFGKNEGRKCYRE